MLRISTNVVNKHLSMLIRNILIAFTTSCVSIFDISNDILYTSFTYTNADFRLTQILHVPLYFIGQKFSHEQIQHGLLFTKKTFNLPLMQKAPSTFIKKQRVLYMVKNNSLGGKGRKYQLYFVIGSFISSPLRVITYSLSILFMQA